MKRENTRLGRCKACRYWKSAADVLAERLPPNASEQEMAILRRAVYEELSMNQLPIGEANRRGWCQAAEQGGTEHADMYAVNIAAKSGIRLISNFDFGCLNFSPRPKRAMNAPQQDFTRNPRLGRCGGCAHWSGAENESNTLYNQGRYSDPTVTREKTMLQALDLLSPPPLDPKTAETRGWCRMALGRIRNSFLQPKILAMDSTTERIGAMITSEQFACSHYKELADPLLRSKPDHLIGRNPNKAYHLGRSASTGDLVSSYIDPSALIDHNNPLSPLHEEHPLNADNPRSLLYNPTPAVAAYAVSTSVRQVILDPNKYKQVGIDPTPTLPLEKAKSRALPTNEARSARSGNLPPAPAPTKQRTDSELSGKFGSRSFGKQSSSEGDATQAAAEEGVIVTEGNPFALPPATPAVSLNKKGDPKLSSLQPDRRKHLRPGSKPPTSPRGPRGGMGGRGR
jgi:hypothetical protein